jgi:uncharacterized membrane protein YdjX (TVP38/TMEM64 family)
MYTPSTASTEAESQRVSESAETDDFSVLLGNLRVLLQGAQVLTSFLIVLPFNTNFGTLDVSDRQFYLATFLCSLVSMILLSAPALHHYVRRPLRHPEQFKRFSTRLVWLGAIFMSLALILATRLVVRQVLTGASTWIVPGVTALLLLGVWWWIPVLHELRTRGSHKHR